MAGRHVDKAGALLGGDEIAQQQRYVELVATPAQWVGGDSARQRRAGQGAEDVVGGDAGCLDELRQQGQRHDDARMRPGERALGDAVDADQRIVDLGPGGDGAAAGHCPGRRGPDYQAGADEIPLRRGRDRICHGDRGADMVVVLDLGLGQRRLLDRAPHHRSQAAIQRPVHQEPPDLAGDGGLGGFVHGGVAMRPVALHAEPPELLLLDAHPLGGVGAALGAELQDRHLILVAAGLAVGFLDLPLDRQPVAVPPRNVGRVVTGHLLGAVHEVLHDLVKRRADVQVPVRVGRPIVQDERRAAGGLGAQAAPDVLLRPLGEDDGLLLREIATHREIGGRQENGVAIVAGFGHVWIRRWRPDGRWAGRGGGGPALGARPGR